jgi:hypothetical protein
MTTCEAAAYRRLPPAAHRSVGQEPGTAANDVDMLVVTGERQRAILQLGSRRWPCQIVPTAARVCGIEGAPQ